MCALPPPATAARFCCRSRRRFWLERSLPQALHGVNILKDLPANTCTSLSSKVELCDFPPAASCTDGSSTSRGSSRRSFGREDHLTKVRDLFGGHASAFGARRRQDAACSQIAREAGRLPGRLFRARPAYGADGCQPVPIELRALRLDIAAARDPIDRLVERTFGGNWDDAARARQPRECHAPAPRLSSSLDRAPTVLILAASQAALHRGRRAGVRTESASGSGNGARRAEEAVAKARAVGSSERALSVCTFVLDSLTRGGGCRDVGPGLMGCRWRSSWRLPRPSPRRRRLDALASVATHLPARQRTLRATLSWS